MSVRARVRRPRPVGGASRSGNGASDVSRGRAGSGDVPTAAPSAPTVICMSEFRTYGLAAPFAFVELEEDAAGVAGMDVDLFVALVAPPAERLVAALPQRLGGLLDALDLECDVV